MKAIRSICLLAGLALPVTAAEPELPVEFSAPMTFDLSSPADPAPGSGLIEVSDDFFNERLGETLARSGAITIRTPRTMGQTVLHAFNPFAPVEPAPETPWADRAAWSTLVIRAVPGGTPVETRQEAVFGMMLCSW